MHKWDFFFRVDFKMENAQFKYQVIVPYYLPKQLCSFAVPPARNAVTHSLVTSPTLVISCLQFLLLWYFSHCFTSSFIVYQFLFFIHLVVFICFNRKSLYLLSVSLHLTKTFSLWIKNLYYFIALNFKNNAGFVILETSN